MTEHDKKTAARGLVPVVSFVGRSGSGKTTLLEKVVAELTHRGHVVGTVKHDAHGFEIDREGKDSWRHKRAGARTVVLASSSQLAVIKDIDAEWSPHLLVSTFLTDVDVVVAEGFKESGFPKIEVVREANTTERVCRGNPLLMAVATDITGIDSEVPVFSIDDHMAITSLIETEIIGAHAPSTVSIIADGTPVELNPFVERLIREAFSGMLSTLRGCADASEMEIRIRLK